MTHPIDTRSVAAQLVREYAQVADMEAMEGIVAHGNTDIQVSESTFYPLTAPRNANES